MTPVAGGLGLSLVIVGGFFAFYFIVVTRWTICHNEENSDGNPQLVNLVSGGILGPLRIALDQVGKKKKATFARDEMR